MTKRGKGIKAAIRLYQQECAAQHLPLECAIAQLLKHVVNLIEAREMDSHMRIGSAVGALCREFVNVRKCFRAEYPEGIDWRDHEQGSETPDSKASAARLRETTDREENSPPSGIVWSDGEQFTARSSGAAATCERTYLRFH